MKILFRFMQTEAAGGIIIALMAVIAMIMANSPLAGFYDQAVHFGLHGINDGLMAVFFLLVGLEIKREVKSGELSSRGRALLPALGALGGIAVPALIYVLVNRHSPENFPGWAIPSATDIAFALAVVFLLGARVPKSISVLLMAIAVIDDLAAIGIIAVFYAHGLALGPLYIAAAAIAVLAVLNRRGVRALWPYLATGLVLWAAILQSGIHATMAGVITALFIPHFPSTNEDDNVSPCVRLENILHPWVAFGILPLFALANAGVSLEGMGIEALKGPVTLGIIAGLVLGKPLGVFSALYMAVKSGLCPKPDGATWSQLFAMTVICGIGFTMSLFIGGLAFPDVQHQAAVRLGVLTASVIAAGAGYALMRLFTKETA